MKHNASALKFQFPYKFNAHKNLNLHKDMQIKTEVFNESTEDFNDNLSGKLKFEENIKRVH